MSKPGNTGRLVLNTHSQAALWEHELTGQISDGMWENSRPWEHYKFWGMLEVVIDPNATPAVETPKWWEIKKKSYAFERVYNLFYPDTQRYELRERMINIGRLALALASLGLPFEYEQHLAAEDMPDTLDEFIRKAVADTRFSAAVSLEAATEYYARFSSYGFKEMKKDVAVISGAMKNIVRK